MEEGRPRELAHRDHVPVDARPQGHVLDVAGHVLEARRDRRPHTVGEAPHHVGDHGMGGLRACLHDPGPVDVLQHRRVLVPADDHRERRRPLRGRERAIVGDRLMCDRHDAGAARRDQPRRLLHGGVVRTYEVRAAEGLAAVHRRVGHHHPDETDRDRPHADHVVTRQLEPRAHVRSEAHRRELLQAIPELLGREVVLVVAEDDVRHADGVEAVDHAAPGVDAREEARSEEVAGEHDDERVAVGPCLVMIDERLQPGEVLERIDVVDGDDA